MPLFDIVIAPPEEVENSQGIARGIYNLLVAGNSRHKLFKFYKHNKKHIEWVYEKAKELEKDAIASIIADPTQTVAEWRDSVSVTLLHKATILQDVIKYNPTYDAGRTFEQFVTAVTSEEQYD